MKESRLFYHRRDRVPVFFVISVFLAQMVLFFAVKPIWAIVAITLILLPFQLSAIAINHNHHHFNTFRVSWMNRLFETLLFFQTGTSPYSWTLHHVIGHHRHYLDQRRDTSPWLTKTGTVMGRLHYLFRNSLMIYPEIVSVGREHPKVFKKFLFMFILNLSILGLFFFQSPLKTVVVFIIPMVLMIAVLVDTTYSHHAGLDTENAYEASNNLIHKNYNIFSWNLGYHTAHHLKPGLHWTELPAFHEEIKHKIPRQLIAVEWVDMIIHNKNRSVENDSGNEEYSSQ